jgi:hypothetical protein
MTRDEESHVGMRRGHVRIARVQHEGHTERFPVLAGEFRSMGGGGGRELVAMNVRERDTGLFEQPALVEDSRPSAATLGARPLAGEMLRCRRRFQGGTTESATSGGIRGQREDGQGGTGGRCLQNERRETSTILGPGGQA